MTDEWVIVLMLVTSFNGGPEVTQLSGVSEIAINGSVAVILGVNRNVASDLTVRFFLMEGRL
jgi:hypothetical protein